jgi:hypothetical protein
MKSPFTNRGSNIDADAHMDQSVDREREASAPVPAGTPPPESTLRMPKKIHITEAVLKEILFPGDSVKIK